MRHVGNIELIGLGVIKNARFENLAEDPLTPTTGQLWYNTAEGVYKGFDGTTIQTFAVGGNTQALLDEINEIETGTGLNANGSYSAPSGSNYLEGTSSVMNAVVTLDGQIKTNADAITGLQTTSGNQADALSALQTEVNAVETGAGLNADGTFTAPVGTNYLGAVTSLKAADVALDAQIKTNADAIDTKVAKAGDTMTGNLAFGGTARVTGLAAPQEATDAVRLIDLDNRMSGLDFQADVVGTEADFAGVPGRYIYIDGSTFVAGSSGAAANDIVEVDAAGNVEAVAYDVSEAGAGALTWSTIGVVWMRYDGTTWSVFGGLGDLNAGVGLSKTGNVIQVNLGAGVAQLPTDEVGIDVRASGGLFLTVDGVASSTDSAAQLAIKLDGATLALGANGLKVGDAGVGNAQLAAEVAGLGLTGGAGQALAVGAGTGILVNADNVELDLEYADARWLTLAGGTMLGNLILNGDPTVALGAVTKQYADAIGTKAGQSFYEYDGSTSQTVHTITHNIGSKYVGVTVYDSSDNVVIPDRITAVDANTVEVVFASAMTCKALVCAKKV